MNAFDSGDDPYVYATLVEIADTLFSVGTRKSDEISRRLLRRKSFTVYAPLNECLF